MANNKFYPASSEEMAKMLGLIPSEPAKQEKPAAEPVVPVAPVPAAPSGPMTAEEILAQDVAAITGTVPVAATPAPASPAGPSVVTRVLRVLLGLVPYLLLFAILIGVYYFFFADASNRPEVFKKVQPKAPTAAEQRANDLADLQKEERSDFNAWIRQYYYDVSDTSLLAFDFVAPNKLTNFENYLLKLSPKTNDVRNTGITDAESVLNGVDPVTGQPLADWQRDIIAKYFDTDAIRTRIHGRPATQSQGAVTPRVAQATTTSGSGDATGVCAENKLGINTDIPGRLEVPSMGVNVPIIWTKDAKNFDEDLKSGVVHYPCTPLPGDVGTSYISGHSSNYAWVKADFNQVFAKMGELADGATFKVTVVGQDGKDIRLYYVVQRKTVYATDDQAQFANTADSVVALSTCWPLNTTEKRMVAYGKLERTER